ncbi:MAG: hypothetical protein ACOCX9_05120 [Spirochaetota bacterium]
MAKEIMQEVIKFISGEIKSNPDIDRSKLVNEASQKFDLNPMQTEYLLNTYVYSNNKTSG